MRRRDVLAGVGAAVAALSHPRPVRAQSAANWPDRPVKLILPYAPGGATDQLARPWGEALSKAFGQQFVIENRGGASGLIGTEAAAKSAPDGYTFLVSPNSPITLLPFLRQVNYDPKSFEPVARVGDLVAGFVVHPSVGVRTFKELIDYAKKNPGKLVYGSSGQGTSNHLRLETLKYRAGIDILHVPYRGSSDALNDLLPGTVQMMNEIVIYPHVKAGKLVLLAISHSSRLADFPDVPTLTEAGYPNSDVPIWYSILAPGGTPKDIIAKLNAKVVEIAATDEMKARMRSIYVEVPLQTPDEIRKFWEADAKSNAELIKATNLKAE